MNSTLQNKFRSINSQTQTLNVRNLSDNNNTEDDLYKLFGLRATKYLKQNSNVKMSTNSSTGNRKYFAYVTVSQRVIKFYSSQNTKLCKDLCKENFNITVVFNSFKIKSYFSYKNAIPDDLKSFVVYKFTCARCSSSYIGETCRHFKTLIDEHIKKFNKSGT